MKCKKCNYEIEHFTFSADVVTYGLYQKDYPTGDDWQVKGNGEWKNLKLFCPNCETEYKEIEVIK